jgi:acyl-CoA reductase-like NAD-dependent aldehyde dehydrogenase
MSALAAPKPGTCSDASAADMDEAIAAARRAFDDTRWSTDAAFRKRCLTQLHEGLAEERENLRSILVAEAGVPVALTHWHQLDLCVDAPFGGYRESGLGCENGSMGYEEYLEAKRIASPAR